MAGLARLKLHWTQWSCAWAGSCLPRCAQSTGSMMGRRMMCTPHPCTACLAGKLIWLSASFLNHKIIIASLRGARGWRERLL